MMAAKWKAPLRETRVDHYVAKLREDEPFGIARYGDGEWLTILGHIGLRNSNGCTFTRELSIALQQVLKNNYPYEHAILRIAKRKLWDEIGQYVISHKCKVSWTLGDGMLRASLEGKLWPLIRELRKRRIVYVGPKHLRGLSKRFFPLVAYIQVPRRNAITQRARIVLAIINAITETKANVVGFSSGLHTKVFLDDVWTLTNGQITLIDFGSIWDGYFNVKSRSYIRRGNADFKKLYLLNTGKQ